MTDAIPVVYYNEYRDITTTVFIAKVFRRSLIFELAKSCVVTAGGSCYPLSANVIEVFDEDGTHKFKDERKTLTDHEAMLSQIIHAAQEYEETRIIFRKIRGYIYYDQSRKA